MGLLRWDNLRGISLAGFQLVPNGRDAPRTKCDARDALSVIEIQLLALVWADAEVGVPVHLPRAYLDELHAASRLLRASIDALDRELGQ